MRKAGTPCKEFIYDEPTGKCPFCGQPIGMSKNKLETHRDCLVNHRCDGVIAAEAMGITRMTIVNFWRVVNHNAPINLDELDDRQFYAGYIAYVKGDKRHVGNKRKLHEPEKT